MSKYENYDRKETWAEIWSPGGLETAEAMADSMSLPPGSAVLDGGAGSSEISCFLAAEYKWNVLSMEKNPGNPNAIQRKVNERGVAGVVAIRGDLTDLDLADESVDGVFCYGVFEMIKDQRPKALREMQRVLRLGGTLAIGEPMLTDEVPNDVALQMYGEDDQLGFRECFRTLEWNVDLAERTGLDVVAAYHHPESKRFWDEDFAKLLDERGELKEEMADRKAEVDIWKNDSFERYHSVGVLVLKRSK